MNNPDTNDPQAWIVLTAPMIEAGRSARGGFTRDQLACLGVAWPPAKGWKKAVAGAEVRQKDYAQFLALRG